MSKIKVRKAKINDAKLVLKIYNSCIKSGFFCRTKLIKLEDHIKWYYSKLESDNSSIYIGELCAKNTKKFGYVRFDEVYKRIWEVSIGNLPDFYGKGLGSTMLKLGIRNMIGNKKPKKIIAKVRKFNVRSQKMFLKNTFFQTKYNKKKHFTINKFRPKFEFYYERII